MCKLVIWNTADLGHESLAEVAQPPKTYEYLSFGATQLIGALGSGGAERLVFLQGNWISAIKSKTAHSRRISRHSFLPSEWLSTEDHRDLMMDVTSRGNVLVVRRLKSLLLNGGSSGLNSTRCHQSKHQRLLGYNESSVL